MSHLKVSLVLLAAVAGGGLRAAEVYVTQQAAYGGKIEQLDRSERYTGSDYRTVQAPVYGGYIFTHWTSSATEYFSDRDVFGRAYDSAKFKLVDTVTLTANYVDASLDSDKDGVADGYEIYWYGNLSQNAASDTDGDGMTFAEELQYGTNPLFPENGYTGVSWGEGEDWLYNPNGYHRYVIRSEPEGELFATISGYAKEGTDITTPTCDRLGSFFSYWTTGGAAVRDVFGRAADTVKFTMPATDVEYIAVVVEDETARAKMYWYGSTSIALTSDTDGDGMTLAEEIAAGTNPLMPEFGYSGVVTDQGEEWFYNPNDAHRYVIRSEPEGALFETVSGYAKAGETVTTPTCDRLASFFAQWTINGVRQADAFGRAMDRLSFAMPREDIEVVALYVENDTEREQLYWYGGLQSLESDTDGDGMTFAEEIAAGSNPLMAEFGYSGVVTEDGEDVEMNLQPYEQAQGAVMGEKFAEIFTSPTAGNGATSETFDANLQPVVADVNGDGLWDLVLVSGSGVKVLVNVGAKGNPEFEERVVDVSAVDLAMNSTEKLDTLDLDTPVIGALSATVWGEALLASDTEGRIWYYRGTAVTTPVAEDGDGTVSYQLQHKVWGGSYAGFAQGLRLAAVDWDDDGDIDCLAGTAEGKLMLLRDPKVGRPTNLKALVGMDNVKLDWDPNQQSRIRGYRVYRKDANDGKDEKDWSFLSLPSFESLGLSTTLPTYRDYPPSVSDFDYKVSSVSRHYVAGNSTPIESESPATEAVRASLGKVKFFWNDVAVKQGERAEVLLSIENSLNYDVSGKTQVVTYDPAYLTPLKIVKTGLTENVSYEESIADGKWTITLKSGSLAAGGGKFFTLVFDTLKAGTTKVGEATVTIVARQEPALYRLGDVTGDGVVDTLDLRELAKLKSAAGRKWTANQLKAGDFNGNGLLDNADYQALRDLLKERGLL